jgi:hypothetical protein
MAIAAATRKCIIDFLAGGGDMLLEVWHWLAIGTGFIAFVAVSDLLTRDHDRVI